MRDRIWSDLEEYTPILICVIPFSEECDETEELERRGLILGNASYWEGSGFSYSHTTRIAT